jgi:divalent metal cation (Fe/Co/Zn/Cd) transporter
MRRGRATMAVIQLVASATLLASILVAASAISIGIAGAQSLSAGGEPDASLVLTLLAIAVAVMGILSAAAVRFAGRPRSR